MLPAGNVFVQVMKLLYCVNLVYSYRINIVPTFTTLEVYLLGVKETNKDEEEESEEEGQNSQRSTNNGVVQEDKAQIWKVNLVRSLVVLITVIVVIFVAKKLDKFYAISGAVLGMTNVLLLPTIIHMKLAAVSTCQKILNGFLISLAFMMIVFLPITIIS